MELGVSMCFHLCLDLYVRNGTHERRRASPTGPCPRGSVAERYGRGSEVPLSLCPKAPSAFQRSTGQSCGWTLLPLLLQNEFVSKSHFLECPEAPPEIQLQGIESAGGCGKSVAGGNK